MERAPRTVVCGGGPLALGAVARAVVRGCQWSTPGSTPSWAGLWQLDAALSRSHEDFKSVGCSRAAAAIVGIPHYISSSNPAASDSNPGTDPSLPWKTLQRATAAAPTFGTAGTDVGSLVAL
jgi:hypothetical protein